MSNWNPGLYLKFKEERTQPAKDLISRINIKYPERILDIGCGPGNSSHELKQKWRNAEVLGLDSSRTMVEKAINDCPGVNFVLADATDKIEHLGTFDIIFSNAAMQWMPDIKQLLPKYFKMLNPGGVIAMQIPNPSAMPIQISIDEVAGTGEWGDCFEGFSNGLHLFEPGYYYEILKKLTDDLEIWETHYHHIMPSHDAIIEWYSSTGMKPYLEKIAHEKQKKFKNKVLERIKYMYSEQTDGIVMFPFRRIFFTAFRH